MTDRVEQNPPIYARSFDPKRPLHSVRRAWLRIMALSPLKRFQLLRRASDALLRLLQFLWPIKARVDQLPPDVAPNKDDWLIWLMLGGRGSGKTRAGAEWVNARVAAGAQEIALVGETYNDVREVMVEGESGLLNIGDPDDRPVFYPSRRRLEWPTGAVGHIFSGEDPDGPRGGNFDTAWADEFCAWQYPDATLSNLRLALRKTTALGTPKLVITSTPKPLPALKTLMRSPGLVLTRSRTQDNAPHLDPGFLAAIEETYGGTRLGRQEIHGELIDNHPGALWTREMITRAQTPVPWRRDDFERVIVAVDPPVSTGRRANACGIIVAARVRASDDRTHAVILHDATVQGVSPESWAERVIFNYQFYEADCVIAEVNQGGDLVRSVLSQYDPNLHIRTVHARLSKVGRAHMAAQYYEQGRIHHHTPFPELEDELCLLGAQDDDGRPLTRASPDRADALVWAIDDLLKRPRPRPKVWRL